LRSTKLIGAVASQNCGATLASIIHSSLASASPQKFS
jgi:hypothetical protein